MKQPFISKMITSLLRFFCHLTYKNSGERSTNTAEKQNKKPSHFNPSGYSITKISVGDCVTECTAPDNIKSNYVIFHIHGGSFKLKLTDFYRKQAVNYSKLFNSAVVYSPDYRIYPKVKYPVPLNDVYDSYRKVLDKGIKPNNIIVIGDSCGSNMAAALCMRLRKEKTPMPKALILFSFWGDLSNSGDSYKTNCYRDPFYGIPKRLSYGECEKNLRRITLYARGENLYDPYLSPCFGDFTSFPLTVLVTGSADISQSDSFTAYKKLKKSGADSYLFSYENMFHCFQFVKFLPETKDVFSKIKSLF
ncbi:MAG: alpha/beta hydrolase fold domain-containing protein [Eubacterium sp.]